MRSHPRVSPKGMHDCFVLALYAIMLSGMNEYESTIALITVGTAEVSAVLLVAYGGHRGAQRYRTLGALLALVGLAIFIIEWGRFLAYWPIAPE
jgi:hypothetical protein